MTITQHSCITLACNMCDAKLNEEFEGYIPHFTTVQQARDFQDAWDEGAKWVIQDDGYALCPEDDEQHAAARAALKPAEQILGQQEIPAPHGFKIGDPVVILHRDDEDKTLPAGLRLGGRLGVVTELKGSIGQAADEVAEYSFGVAVYGIADLVWCAPGEIRRAQFTAGAGR